HAQGRVGLLRQRHACKAAIGSGGRAMLAIEGNALRLGAPQPHWRSRIVTRTSRIAWAGYAAVAVLVLGFGVWAATAPISGAVVAPGVVAAAGQNILVQHLEGGI